MDFETNTVDLSVPEFFEQFSLSLPKVVKVTQGFYGEILEDTFDRDQVLRIHTYSKQLRVVAKTCEETHVPPRHYSLPVQYPLKVCVVKPSGKVGKETTLQEIVNNTLLPVKIQFAKNQTVTVATREISTRHFPLLNLTETFDEIYLLANFLNDGVVDMRTVGVPLYLSQLRIAEVTGFKGHPADKWRRYNTELNEQVTSAVTFDTKYGNKDIAEYNPESIKPDTLYSYIEPRTYANISIFEDYSSRPKHPAHVKDRPGASSNPTYETKSQPQHAAGHQPKRAHPGHSEAVSQPSTVGKAQPGTKGRDLPAAPGNQDVYEEIRVEEIQSGSQPAQKDPIARGVVSELSETFEKRGTQAPPPPLAPKPDSKSSGKETGPPIVPKRDEKSHNSPTVPQRIQHNTPYVNDIPRETVRPVVLPPPEIPAQTLTLTSKGPTAEAGVDVKDDANKPDKPEISSLTIEELSGWLVRLKLEKYVEKFRDEMVDGSMLEELDADLLKDEFHMTKLETLRLLQFARKGHVPK